MRNRSHILLLATVTAIPLGAADEAVSLPAARQASLTAAQQLLAPRETGELAKVANPFLSEAFAQAVSGAGRAGVATAASTGTEGPVTRPAGPRTEHDLLASIAGAIKPSGYFVLGGQPTLVFGQKRVKAGDPLTIAFEGTEYTLEVIAIDRTSFTLRLNREEFTRPIK